MEKSKVISIDPKSLSTTARRRMRTSKEETAILEGFYSKTPNPNHEQKQDIAIAVNMGVKNVHFWFQNRRAKENKKRKMLQLKQQDMAQQQQQQIEATQKGQIFQPHYDTPRQQPKDKGKGKYILPPISTIMRDEAPSLSIPFYFHHKDFGIEDCMLQWSKNNDSNY